ncbi:MAG: GlxA family transcriptional regulator [Acidimicrobiales bacterium]
MATARPAHRVVILTYDGVQSLDVSGPAEVFSGANEVLRAEGSEATIYDVTVVSPDGGIVATESSVRIDTDPFTSIGRERIDTLVIPGGFSVMRHRDNRPFIDQIARLVERSDRLVTVCSGTYLAAAAGTLAGHTVTTHWARSARLAELHPDLSVDHDPIFIHSPGSDRDVWSSAGVTAGIDLSLALVEHDHSTDVAQTVARWLVMYLRRPGGQSQFASPTWIRQAAPGPIQVAQNIIIEEPGTDLRVASLAERVAMSERHFVRRFTTEVGMPPAKFVARIRVDAARHELERSSDTVAAIAQRCGFGTAETLRRSLHRHLGVSPEGYRQRFNHRSTQEVT